MEIFLADVFTNFLSIDPENKSFVLTESVFEDQFSRSKLMEIMFESFTANKLVLLSDAACSFYSFQMKKKKIFDFKEMTGLLIETGHKQTAIVPMVEGHIIEQGICNYPINGHIITNALKKDICKHNPKLKKNYDKETLYSISEKIKHKYNALELNSVKPKLGLTEIDIKWRKKNLKIKLDSLMMNPMNLYFEMVF